LNLNLILGTLPCFRDLKQNLAKKTSLLYYNNEINIIYF
jgi:hypothetical protein